MKFITGLTAVVLFSIIYCRGSALAAVDSIEIDLKDLGPRRTDPDKSRHRDTREPRLPPKKTGGTDPLSKTSNYIVKSGDYLFKILIRHYALSNDDAERLIPEVMRLNSISNPKSLTVGQQLTIPLAPSQNDKQNFVSNKKLSSAPLTSLPARELPSPAQTSQNRTPGKSELQATISEVSACALAHAVIVNLGLLSTETGLQLKTGFTAATSDLKLVVACDLSPEESFTYGRLLSMHKVRLIVFKGDESPKRVIEELASHLNLSFQMDDSTDTGALALTCVFPAKSPDGKDVRLIINTTNYGNASEAR